jgi:hypothetical protein
MKQISVARYSRMLLYILFCTLLINSIPGCKKEDALIKKESIVSANASDATAFQYSSEVIDKWITMQLRLDRDAVGIPNNAFSRYYAYSGIAALESLTPGLSPKDALTAKWNGLSGMPAIESAQSYYWPASVNTALATMNRDMFTMANDIDKAAVDSLENALNASYLLIKSTAVITRSNAYGKSVADAVFNWSETDGYTNASNPYTPPAGRGLWVPTSPVFAPASTPYWGNNRPIISGDIDNTQPAAPITYSEKPGSPFYKMAYHVYWKSLHLTHDDSVQALFWRDIPGVTSPGHWLSILQQVIHQTNSHLDKAAFAYALTGTCLSDAAISCWQTKYHNNLVRPITYIQNVMEHTTWASLLTTPAHPEYSSAHAAISAATADALTALFGNIGSFTDHTYDYMGFAPRTFNSFRAIGEDAGHSRLYAGIHYQPSIDVGLIQGRKVTANILGKIGLH